MMPKGFIYPPLADALKLKALNCLPDIGDQMINTRNDTVQATTNKACTSASVSASAADQIKEKTADDDFDFYFDNSDSEPGSENIIFISKKVAIAEETKKFKNLLANSKYSVSTKDFWKENKKTLPLLFELTLILLNIPSSSAYVERFFSICGVVNRKRTGIYTEWE